MSRKNHQKRNFCQKTSLCLDASKVIISTVITVRILTISNIKFAQMFQTVIAWWFYVTDYNHWSMHSRNLWLFVISMQNDLFLMTYHFWKFAGTPKEIELIFEHHRACSKGWNSFVEFKLNIFIIFSVEIKNHRSVIILSSVQVFKTVKNAISLILTPLMLSFGPYYTVHIIWSIFSGSNYKTDIIRPISYGPNPMDHITMYIDYIICSHIIWPI